MIYDTSIQDYNYQDSISLNNWTYWNTKKREWKIYIAIKRSDKKENILLKSFNLRRWVLMPSCKISDIPKYLLYLAN